jgi:putative transposase
VTLKRLDEAFGHFFRRVREGAKEPGFPRFKSKNRFPGFGYKSHGDGFKFVPGENWKNGKLRLSGIGTMQARGAARTPGTIKRVDIMRKSDGWYASLVVECEPHREKGELECGMDWGVETLLTMAYGEDDYDAVANERFLRTGEDDLIEAQRALCRALRGKKSKTATKKRKLYAKWMRKIANKRKNKLHQVTTALVRKHKLIITEELNIENMTASAKGTVEEPGKNVAQKAGLNKSILDTAPGSLLRMLDYKAEEAGCQVVKLNTLKWRPSQTCPSCGCIHKKSLNERVHECKRCGFTASRDEAAALLMLRVGLKELGREPNPETILSQKPHPEPQAWVG